MVEVEKSESVNQFTFILSSLGPKHKECDVNLTEISTWG